MSVVRLQKMPFDTKLCYSIFLRKNERIHYETRLFMGVRLSVIKCPPDQAHGNRTPHNFLKLQKRIELWKKKCSHC